MCPKKKICVLDKHHLGMRYSAIGLGFNVNQQYILNQLSLNRNTLRTKQE